VGLKEPQEELPQVTVQATPLVWLSLLTTAVMLEVVPTMSDVGGAGLKVTESAGVVMLMVATAVLVVSVTEVAVTVTVSTVEGAV
jgi:hypothetical protein